MERTQHAGYAGGVRLHSSGRGGAQLAMLCLVLAQLIALAGGSAIGMTAGTRAAGPWARAPYPQARYLAVRRERPGMSRAPARIIGVTSPAFRLSTGAGGACHGADVTFIRVE